MLLYTGNSFVVTDMEGDPARPLGERRLKRTPFRDVACLMQSFDYAAGSVLHGLSTGKGRPPGLVRPEDRAKLAGWSAAWVEYVGAEFAATYLENVEAAGLLPATPEARGRLLHLLVLEKALQEIDGELTFRRDWVIIPLQAAVRLLGEAPGGPA
jgi:maltose alpha-D-glucosyltransferase/alpha-amylase